MIGKTHQFGHIAEGQLIQQVVPSVLLSVDGDGTIHRNADKLGKGQSTFFAHRRHFTGAFGLILNCQTCNDGIVCSNLNCSLICSGGDSGFRHGVFPVAAGYIHHVIGRVVIKFVQIRMVELVADLGAICCLCVGSCVQRSLLILNGQRSVAGTDHLIQIDRAVGGIFQFCLCYKDIVQSFMGTVAGCKVVIASIDDVGLGAVCIIGAQFALGNGDIHRDGLACGNCDLLKADQFDRSLFDAVLSVIVGIGRLHIDLDSFTAIHRACVADADRKDEVVAFFLHRKTAVLKCGIAQTIAEGISDRGGVVVLADVGIAEDGVLVAGLIVAVTDVDAFLIDFIILVAGALEGKPLLGSVGVGSDIGVLHGRAGEVVVAIGVHQLAAGVDRAVQDVTDCLDAVLTNFADPQAGVHTVVHAAEGRLEEIQFHRVGHIEQNDDGFDLSGSLEVRQLFQDIAFFLTK